MHGASASAGGADEAAWSEVSNQYKRRFDLVPQLVSTVQGAADFEKTTITEVTEARASVGRAQLPAGLPSDPAQLQAYIDAHPRGRHGKILYDLEQDFGIDREGVYAVFADYMKAFPVKREAPNE